MYSKCLLIFKGNINSFEVMLIMTGLCCLLFVYYPARTAIKEKLEPFGFLIYRQGIIFLYGPCKEQSLSLKIFFKLRKAWDVGAFIWQRTIDKQKKNFKISHTVLIILSINSDTNLSKFKLSNLAICDESVKKLFQKSMV